MHVPAGVNEWLGPAEPAKRDGSRVVKVKAVFDTQKRASWYDSDQW
ncbi:MAG TPA: hypothetical protein VGE12_17385 [Noviherbaspirillum sp.]